MKQLLSTYYIYIIKSNNKNRSLLNIYLIYYSIIIINFIKRHDEEDNLKYINEEEEKNLINLSQSPDIYERLAASLGNILENYIILNVLTMILK